MKEKEYKEHRKCAICGKDYIITNPRSKYCDRPHYKQCVICGKDMDYFYRGDCCSNKCRELKRKQTKLEKYGDENYHNMEKAKQTLLKNYGVENVYQLESVKAKIRKTNLERYGVENVYQRPDVRKNCMSKAYTKETKQKRIKTNLERYGVEYACMRKECKEKQGQLISKRNKEMHNLLKDKYNIDTEFEFYITGKTYDLHILNTDILLEINPTYTHNSTLSPKFGKWGITLSPKDKNYHLNRTLHANKNGYRCIHIFDWDDLDEVINKYIINYNKKTEGIVDLSKEDMRLYTINNLVEDKHSVKLGKDLVDVYGVGLLKL